MAFTPLEADPPLAIDAYAVLPGALALQRLQTITGRCAQIFKAHRCVQKQELAPGDPFHCPETRHVLTGQQALHIAVPAMSDHGCNYTAYRYTVNRDRDNEGLSRLATIAAMTSNRRGFSGGLGVQPPETVDDDIARALAEDVGPGDLSAAAIPADRVERARVFARAPGVVCGRPWFDGAFRAVDAGVTIDWAVAEGAGVAAETELCTLQGPARALFTAERTALNFLQLLSGVATATRAYVDAVAGTNTHILDTRKTLPGLRAAQKYAVVCGGGSNHRMGLYDAAMLKENHLYAAGGITAAVRALRAAHPEAPLTVEVETLDQVCEALAAGADRLLLDNFGPDELRAAVAENAGRAWLEASGGITLANVRAVADSGVDCISIGALTKDIQALDLSMRFSGDGLSGGNAPTGGA